MQASQITDTFWIATERVIIQGSSEAIEPPVYFCFIKASEPNSLVLGEMLRDANKRPIVFSSHEEALAYIQQFQRR